jgi:hypothetical protein
MTYRGHIERGAVVLDSDVVLPEGLAVTIDVAETRDVADAGTDPFWGLFADEPELVEQLVSGAAEDRAKRRLRDADVV